MTRTMLLATAVALAPSFAFAVGDLEDITPPTTTSTTSECEGAQIWDKKTETCVAAVESRFNDAERYGAVRELAHAGAYGRALDILGTFENALDDGRLTYLGFVTRQMGEVDSAMNWYQAALDVNPNNLLARSYMGQALLSQGDAEMARAQLREIRARGGRETWPERALELALRDGPSPAY